jgi:prepilin-type processing-associated H-X9-DG protein
VAGIYANHLFTAHRGQGNVLFADGHVKALDASGAVAEPTVFLMVA